MQNNHNMGHAVSANSEFSLLTLNTKLFQSKSFVLLSIIARLF